MYFNLYSKGKFHEIRIWHFQNPREIVDIGSGRSGDQYHIDRQLYHTYILMIEGHNIALTPTYTPYVSQENMLNDIMGKQFVKSRIY